VSYLPIEDYGIIGDMRTSALVGMNGSIDWLCYPHFDSPSVFGALLDAERGGRFRIAPRADGVSQRQFYWPDTNVLVTRFLSEDGVGQIIDYMPVHEGEETYSEVVRHLHVVRGRMHFDMECQPRFDYARADHETGLTGSGAVFHGPGASLGLATDVALERRGHGVGAELVLGEGESSIFVLRGTSGAAGWRAASTRGAGGSRCAARRWSSSS
jgi:GH15 family glucan-1,4-alpha-glucosidase